MKHIQITFFFILIGITSKITAQESQDYIEFNDRKNIVHGFYLGIIQVMEKLKVKKHI